MSTNIVHILTIGGLAAKQVETVCAALVAQRVPDEDGDSFGSPDFSEETIQATNRFCRSVLDAAHALPVLYHATYLDPYSMCDWMFDYLPWPDNERWGHRVSALEHGFTYYRDEDRAHFLETIRKIKRRKSYRGQGDYRWYIDHVEAALTAYPWVKTPRLVMAITHCLGGTREDEDVHAAMKNEMPLDFPPYTREKSCIADPFFR